MTDQEIRAAALRAATVRVGGASYSTRDILELAEKFAEYIRTGNLPAEERRW